MAKLVAYYSRADENYFGGTLRYVEVGNTEKLAKMIAEKTGAELFKIEPKLPYAKDYNTCIEQAKADQKAKERPELNRLLPDLRHYDEIYLGYPIYWSDMPMVVYTFLESLDFEGKKIHPFCTSEGSGLSATDSHIKRTIKGATVSRGLAVTGSQVEESEAKVDAWLRMIK